MKRHRIDCTCGKKAVVCGVKGKYIVYYCSNCCRQIDVSPQGKEGTK